MFMFAAGVDVINASAALQERHLCHLPSCGHYSPGKTCAQLIRLKNIICVESAKTFYFYGVVDDEIYIRCIWVERRKF